MSVGADVGSLGAGVAVGSPGAGVAIGAGSVGVGVDVGSPSLGVGVGASAGSDQDALGESAFAADCVVKRVDKTPLALSVSARRRVFLDVRAVNPSVLTRVAAARMHATPLLFLENLVIFEIHPHVIAETHCTLFSGR